MPQMSRKVLWGVLAAVVVLIVGGLFFLYHRKSTANSCNSLLYEPLKKHLQKDAFNQLKSGFYNVWVTKRFFMTTACSYFTMQADGLAMQGLHNKSEGPQDVYEKFVKRSSGVIDIHPENVSKVSDNGRVRRFYTLFTGSPDVSSNHGMGETSGDPVPSVQNLLTRPLPETLDIKDNTGLLSVHSNSTIGRIYPVFVKDFVVGNVFCDENNGHPEWRSVVSVQSTMLNHDKTASLVSQAIKVFEGLGTEVGLDLGLGESYVTPCYENPQWRDETKN